jgi:hypothetical protein
MNFGDNTRVIKSIDGKPRAFAPGAAKEIDLDEYTHKFVTRAARTHADPLVLVPLGSKMPEAVKAVLDILIAVETDGYDELLAKTVKLLGQDNVKMRPTRGEIMVQLRQIAGSFAADAEVTNADIARVAAQVKKAADERTAPPPLPVHDDVDPADLEEELEESEAKPKKPARQTRAARDNMDDALGIISGDEMHAKPAAKAEKEARPARSAGKKPAKQPEPEKKQRTSRAARSAKAPKQRIGRIRL